MTTKFVSQVDSLIAQEVRKTSSSWHARLDDDARKEVDEIRAKFRKGLYRAASKRAVARAIVAAAKERGWKICGEGGVREWLSRD